MSNPDIQYFAVSGTWVKPAGAVRVDIVLRGGDGGSVTENRGGDGGGASFAHLAGEVIPTAGSNVAPASGASPTSGRLGVLSYDAADLPDAIEVEVGKGGRPGGRDGYALIVTHLAADDEDEDCDCPFDYPYTCPACGHSRITNHCPHDGVQNPCPKCGHTDPGKQTPLQFLGVTRPSGEARDDGH